MGRHRKYPDAEAVISAFYSSVSDAYNHPSAGERNQDGKKSINLLSEEFSISRLKVRKILITTGDVVCSETKSIQQLLSQGKTKKEVCSQLNIAIATLNSFLPYDKGVYNLTDVSNYAENCKVYRTRKGAVVDLQFDPNSVKLWRTICLFQSYPFTTLGRGSKTGTKFTYEVSSSSTSGGRRYAGENVEGYGNEMWIIRDGQRAEKSISRSSVDYALQIALEGNVAGPKQLKIYGSSYVYSLFRRFGLV